MPRRRIGLAHSLKRPQKRIAMAAEMTDEEWVGRWGLQRGATVGVDDHLTMMLAEDESGTPILIPPPPDTVLTYNEPTPGYCCPLTANTYGIDFERFHIRDMSDQDNLSGGAILFEECASHANAIS